jgi:hypothetical protein
MPSRLSREDFRRRKLNLSCEGKRSVFLGISAPGLIVFSANVSNANPTLLKSMPLLIAIWSRSGLVNRN